MLFALLAEVISMNILHSNIQLDSDSMQPLQPNKPVKHSISAPINYSQDYAGPSLVITKSTITDQVNLFKQALPNVVPYYAVKANPIPEVIQHLNGLDVFFEIASLGELELLKSLKIKPSRIIYSNPVKTPISIQAAYEYGINWYSFDCKEELEKLNKLAPHGHYELRLSSSGKGSVWPLNNKFGVDDDDALELIEFAISKHIKIAGLTFHVGSQCTESKSWIMALERCQTLLKLFASKHMPIKLLNIGGGFPCHMNSSIPDFQLLMQPVKAKIISLMKDHTELKLCAEPGRFLLASSGVLTCQIIGTTIKKQQPWAFLDCGYYNGLMELSADFGYELVSNRPGKAIPWVIAGPTCDSIDCFTPNYLLPEKSASGDVIQIPNMGAYANTCVSNFNGFDGPKLYVID